MTFTIRSLENNGGSGAGARLFSYSTADNKAAVKGTGYFNNASTELKVGDKIYIACSDANFDAHVSAISGGVVTIAAIDTFA